MGKIYGVPEKGEAAAAKLDQQVKAVTESYRRMENVLLLCMQLLLM